MENHHAINGKTHYKWPFPIAMLNYQRVMIQDISGCKFRGWLASIGTYPRSIRHVTVPHIFGTLGKGTKVMEYYFFLWVVGGGLGRRTADK